MLFSHDIVSRRSAINTRVLIHRRGPGGQKHKKGLKNDILGGRHSPVDSSAPTIVRSQVRIPSTSFESR